MQLETPAIFGSARQLAIAFSSPVSAVDSISLRVFADNFDDFSQLSLGYHFASQFDHWVARVVVGQSKHLFGLCDYFAQFARLGKIEGTGLSQITLKPAFKKVLATSKWR